MRTSARWLVTIFFTASLMLTSCSQEIQQSGQPSEMKASPMEEVNLEKRLEELELLSPSANNMVLKSEVDCDQIPQELIRQSAQALYTGKSGEWIESMNQKELMITDRDFIFSLNENEEDDLYEQDIKSAIESGFPRLLFYQFDIDGDKIDEIVAVEDLKYEYSQSNTAYLLKKSGDAYTLEGYDYLGYYRCFSIFSYDGNYYLAANYDNYKTKTAKAMGLFLLNGDRDGFMWTIHSPHIYLRKNGEGCEYHLLYENTSHSLAEQTKSYIKEIGMDLIYTDRKNQTFYGTEALEEKGHEEKSEREEWRPREYSLAQRWSEEIGGKWVDFSLLRREHQDVFLLDARIYENQNAIVLLDYVIDLDSSIIISDYWDYDDNNLIAVSYDNPDLELAFPENLWEQTKDFATEAQKDFKAEEYKGELLPAPLVTALEQALFEKRPHSPNVQAACPEMDIDLFYDTFYGNHEEVRNYMAVSVYHYSLEQEEYYLLVTDTGGSARLVDIDIFKEKEGELFHLDNLLSLDLSAKVIEYEGDYYLLEATYNYYSKHTDTVTAYKLTSEGVGPYVSVCLVPTDYFWKITYSDSRDWEKEITDYVDEVMESLVKDSVMNDNIQYVMGDETPELDKIKEARLKSVGKDYDYWKIDFNNDGIPEYVSKHFWFPSNSLTIGLISDAYQFTPQRVSQIEEPFYEIPFYAINGNLLQLWFKEIRGKVFTFRLFFFLDCYVLNVSLIEDSHISQVQTWMIVPEYEVTIEEGYGQRQSVMQY